MKVFISWSGDLSRQVAEHLASWIEDVLQGTKTWISSDDIDKGSIWFTDIANQLSETGIGIICLTKENLNSPWLLFEAGGLSKGLTKSRVCPLLINLNHPDLSPPLSQFNGTLPVRDDMLKLVKTINAQSGDKALTDDRLEKTFDRWWDAFEKQFQIIVKNHKPSKREVQRPTSEVLTEILEISRSVQRILQEDAFRRVYSSLSRKRSATDKNSFRQHLDSEMSNFSRDMNEIRDRMHYLGHLTDFSEPQNPPTKPVVANDGVSSEQSKAKDQNNAS